MQPWTQQQVTIEITAPSGARTVEIRSTWQGLTYLGTADAAPLTIAVAALFAFPADRLQSQRELSGPSFAFHKRGCKCPQCRKW